MQKEFFLYMVMVVIIVGFAVTDSWASPRRSDPGPKDVLHDNSTGYLFPNNGRGMQCNAAYKTTKILIFDHNRNLECDSSKGASACTVTHKDNQDGHYYTLEGKWKHGGPWRTILKDYYIKGQPWRVWKYCDRFDINKR